MTIFRWLTCFAFFRSKALGCGWLSEGVRDLSGVISKGGEMVEPLKSKDYFDRVFVELGAPTWPNGFDLDPINLYMQMRDAGELSREAAE